MAYQDDVEDEIERCEQAGKEFVPDFNKKFCAKNAYMAVSSEVKASTRNEEELAEDSDTDSDMPELVSDDLPHVPFPSHVMYVAASRARATDRLTNGIHCHAHALMWSPTSLKEMEFEEVD